MRISVFGMGYVGAVSGACLAEMGHEVIGVDVDTFKVQAINEGRAPIIEEKIAELTQQVVSSGQFRATTDTREAIANTELSLICVGTPSRADGGLETAYVERVSHQIGQALRDKDSYHLVVVRSTVLPGTVETLVLPILEKESGRSAPNDFDVCFHPEFLREGSSVKDFHHPPKIVAGVQDEKASEILRSIYAHFEQPVIVTSIRAAEMVKYADNCFHALKVIFGNEIGTLCKTLGIDSHEVMNIFIQDRKLNISPAYLMPGFAYGGSCLPKDLAALTYMARAHHIELPMLSSLSRSNELHIQRVATMISQLEGKTVGMLGLSFKPGTDDLRGSPYVELAERLLGKGYEIKIHDNNVSLSRLHGGNKAYIEQKLPHISSLLHDSLDEVIATSDILIVGSPSADYRSRLENLEQGKAVIDMVRLFDNLEQAPPGYQGICW